MSEKKNSKSDRALWLLGYTYCKIQVLPVRLIWFGNPKKGDKRWYRYWAMMSWSDCFRSSSMGLPFCTYYFCMSLNLFWCIPLFLSCTIPKWDPFMWWLDVIVLIILFTSILACMDMFVTLLVWQLTTDPSSKSYEHADERITTDQQRIQDLNYLCIDK